MGKHIPVVKKGLNLVFGIELACDLCHPSLVTCLISGVFHGHIHMHACPSSSM